MPIHEYKCRDGHTFEELFFQREDVPDVLPCPRPSCDSAANRRKVNWFRHVGPVFEDMDRYESALLGTKRRRDPDKNGGRGERFRGAKDVAREEQSRGLNRLDTGSVRYKTMQDDMRDEVATMQRIEREDGKVGVADWIERQNITEASGMTDIEYVRWKDTSDAIESAATAGNVDLSGGQCVGADA